MVVGVDRRCPTQPIGRDHDPLRRQPEPPWLRVVPTRSERREADELAKVYVVGERRARRRRLRSVSGHRPHSLNRDRRCAAPREGDTGPHEQVAP